MTGFRTQASPGPASPEPVWALLRQARAVGASDLHLAPDRAPFVRLGGRLVSLSLMAESDSGNAAPPNPATLDRAILAAFVDAALGAAGAARLAAEGAATVGLALPDEQPSPSPPPAQGLDPAGSAFWPRRLRLTVLAADPGPVVACRLLPDRPPDPDRLGVPPAIRALAGLTDGLVLLGGGTGSGKTTTAAALLESINQAGGRHILTIEDPIEYRLHPRGGPVTQREVAEAGGGLAAALRQALRADPDVVLIGEIRSADALLEGLGMAQSGHLVLATVHAGSVVGVVDRLLGLVPPAQRSAVREALAACLAAIVHQRLVAGAEDRSHGLSGATDRRAAVALAIGTPAVRAAIRDGQERQIPALMTVGRAQGMIPPDEEAPPPGWPSIR